MTTYHLKAGDTAPSPRTQLLAGDGAAVPLTGAAVRFKARLAPGLPTFIDRPAVVEDPAANDGEEGWVHFDPQAADTTTTETYLVEWQVTYGTGQIQSFPGEGFDRLVVAADLDNVEAAGTGYATIAAARAQGAEGTTVEVAAAIAEAELRVDRYTRSSWAARVRTVQVALDSGGMAVLPARIDTAQPITVRALGATADLPATAYQVTSSDTLGALDRLYLGAGRHDVLVAGAEPWNGGWAGLLGDTREVLVTGTFGPAVTPSQVAAATAVLAASITAPSPLGTGTASELDADDEGNAVTITEAGPDVPAGQRTTGNATVDAMLAPYVRARVLVS